MSHFILPVTIESRKILFLDLDPVLHAPQSLKTVGEDEYIVEIPVNHPRTVLSIPQSKLIQSLHEEIDDLPIKDLTVQFKYNEKERVLLIHVSNEQSSSSSKTLCQLETDLILKSEIFDEEIRLVLISTPNLRKVQTDHFFVNFHLKVKEDDFTYVASIKLCLANRQDILLTGFDFGSEASQISEGRYNSSENATINRHPIDLFSAIKDHQPSKNVHQNNTDYIQYENESLYKSIFYLKKEIAWNDYKPHSQLPVPADAINTLTPKKDLSPLFFNEWIQIPNLKLIHDNPSLTNSYKFTIISNDETLSTDLSDIRISIYAALLKEMIISHFSKRRIHRDVYLRFTLLVPNIYTIGQINETKQIIRNIILEPGNGFNQYVKGVEISSLSESDAAFLGHLIDREAKAGNYYIIIDCGKGTTDFSIIQAQQDNAAIFKPIYRNGFAGAGNLITFAFMQSALHYLEKSSPEILGPINFDLFIKRNLSKGPQNNIKSDLFDMAELWKKNHSSNVDKIKIEQEWTAIKTGDITLSTLFASDRDEADIRSFFVKPQHAYDWGGYVESAVNNIVKKIRVTLAPVIVHMNKTSKCDGILFTGRGFMFKPLKEAAKNALQSIKGMENVNLLEISDRELKDICLKGVFARNIISYSDIVSTPIEITKGKLKQFTKADIKRSGFFGSILHFFNQLTRADGAYYDEATNSCPVINPDFNNCQFLIGGNIYQPDWTNPAPLETAHLVHSRKGFFIRAKNIKQQVFILEVPRVDNQVKEFQQDTLIKSLCPSWFDPDLLKNNQ